MAPVWKHYMGVSINGLGSLYEGSSFLRPYKVPLIFGNSHSWLVGSPSKGRATQRLPYLKMLGSVSSYPSDAGLKYMDPIVQIQHLLL